MDVLQLQKKMNADICMRNKCWGVFAQDELLQTLLNGGYIINTDNRNQPGRYWVALWIDDNYLEFTDWLITTAYVFIA